MRRSRELITRSVYTASDDTLHLYDCWMYDDPVEVPTLCGVTARGASAGGDDDFDPGGYDQLPILGHPRGTLRPVHGHPCQRCADLVTPAPVVGVIIEGTMAPEALIPVLASELSRVWPGHPLVQVSDTLMVEVEGVLGTLGTGTRITYQDAPGTVASMAGVLDGILDALDYLAPPSHYFGILTPVDVGNPRYGWWRCNPSGCVHEPPSDCLHPGMPCYPTATYGVATLDGVVHCTGVAEMEGYRDRLDRGVVD